MHIIPHETSTVKYWHWFFVFVFFEMHQRGQPGEMLRGGIPHLCGPTPNLMSSKSNEGL